MRIMAKKNTGSVQPVLNNIINPTQAIMIPPLRNICSAKILQYRRNLDLDLVSFFILHLLVVLVNVPLFVTPCLGAGYNR